MRRPVIYLVIEQAPTGETILARCGYLGAVAGLRSRQAQHPSRDFRMIQEKFYTNSSITLYSKSQGSGSAVPARRPAQQWDVVSPSGGTRSKQAQSKANAKIDNILPRLQARPLLLPDAWVELEAAP